MNNGRLITIGISAVLIVVCLLWLPGIEGRRDNSLFILPIVTMLGCALCTAGRNLSISLLMAYTACHIYFVTTTYGAMSTVYQFAAFSVVYAFVVLKDGIYARRNIIYNSICLVAIVNVAAMIPQAFHVYLLPAIPAGIVYDRAFGLTANPNEVSALLAMCLPFFFRRRWAWCIPAIILGLVLARTTNGILAAAFISIIYLFIGYRNNFINRVALASIPLCLLMYCTFVDRFDLKDHLNGRGVIYQRTAQLASVHPTGWGFYQYKFIMPMVTYANHMSDVQKIAAWVQFSRKDLFDRSLETISGTTDGDKMKAYLRAHSVNAAFVQAHNEYLEWMFIAGYAGLGLLIMALIMTLKRAYLAEDKIPALSLTASACTAALFFSWQIISTGIITVFTVAMIHGYKKVGA